MLNLFSSPFTSDSLWYYGLWLAKLSSSIGSQAQIFVNGPYFLFQGSSWPGIDLLLLSLAFDIKPSLFATEINILVRLVIFSFNSSITQMHLQSMYPSTAHHQLSPQKWITFAFKLKLWSVNCFTLLHHQNIWGPDSNSLALSN